MTTNARRAILIGACLPVVIMVAAAILRPGATLAQWVGVVCLIFASLSLLAMPFDSPEARPRIKSLIDGAIVGTALWAFGSVIVFSGVRVPSATTMLSPLLFLLMVGLLGLGLATAIAIRVAQEFRRSAWLAVVGILLLDVFLLTLATASSSSWAGQGTVLSVWQLIVLVSGGLSFFAGLATAALLPEPDRAVALDAADSRRIRVATALPSIMVGAVMGMAVVMAISGRPITTVDYITGLAFLGLLVVHQVVANRERATLTAQLRSRGELFQSLVTGSSDWITMHDQTGRVKYASPAVFRFLESNQRTVLGATLWDLIHPDDRGAVQASAAALLATPGETAMAVMRLQFKPSDERAPSVDSELDMPDDDVEWRWVQTRIHNLIEDANVGGIVCNTRDIHDQHELGVQLSHEAYHDALTGLGNLALARKIFADHSYGVDRTPTTLILADLDGFKTLNDTFGHAFGDELLVAVARRLRRSVSDDDAIARIGGDEFVLIFDSEADARTAAQSVIEALNKPLLVQGTSVIVHSSMGIARSIDASCSEELLRNADLAMYEAKAQGGNTFVSYDEQMFEQTARRMQIQEGLRAALDNDRFELAFQPIMDLRTRSVSGAEALLRWEDPDLGRVPPDIFIPVAESSGLIAQIDKWVLTAACTHITRWRAAGLAVPTISINVSRRQITDGLEGLIAEVIAATAVRGSDICVEVTESAVVPDPEAAVRVLQSVRSLGALVALDDFGTGQSSLSQLAKLPIDRVKIDKSFVMPSSQDPAALGLLTSIVGLCRSLKLPIVAEGIEDEQAAQNLVAMGAEYGQGYYFHRPMAAADFVKLIRASVPGQRNGHSIAPTVEQVRLADQFEVIADEETSRADPGHHE